VLVYRKQLSKLRANVILILQNALLFDENVMCRLQKMLQIFIKLLQGLEKSFSLSEKKIIIGSIKFCLACDKLIWKAPNSSLDKGKLQFG
jgi:hypothetical protein